MEAINSGEFWLAKFKFAEDDRTKIRPVLVLDVKPYGVEVVYCSTQKTSKAFPCEVILSKDEALSVGLIQEGRIDFGKRQWLPISDFTRKVGKLGQPGEKLSKQKFRELAMAANAAGLV